MHLSYSQVSQANAQTLSIDVYLEALDDYNLDVPVQLPPYQILGTVFN